MYIIFINIYNVPSVFLEQQDGRKKKKKNKTQKHISVTAVSNACFAVCGCSFLCVF